MKRKRIKLNMLNPGIRMCQISGILLVVALILYFIGVKHLSFITAGAAVALFLVLLILVKIELYQDNQDYLRWKNSKETE